MKKFVLLMILIIGSIFLVGCANNSSINDVIFCSDVISKDDFNNIDNTLRDVIDNEISSIDELVSWLDSQKCINSVSKGGIIETAPPIYEIDIEFNLNDGSVIKKVLDIYSLEENPTYSRSLGAKEGQKFKYVKMHD